MNAYLESTPGRAHLAVFVLSLATIAGAWGFELIGGYLPCPLCLQQRWAYYAVVPLSLVLLLAAGAIGPGLLRVGLVVCGLIMLGSMVFGVYHSGIEWGWWTGPAACSGGGGFSAGVLPDLDNAVFVPCNEAQLRILGLSFAGWNAVVSLAIAGLAIYAASPRT